MNPTFSYTIQRIEFYDTVSFVTSWEENIVGNNDTIYVNTHIDSSGHERKHPISEKAARDECVENVELEYGLWKDHNNIEQ